MVEVKSLKKGCRYWDAVTERFGFFVAYHDELAELEDDDNKIFTACPTKLHKASYWEDLRVRHPNHGTGVIDRWRGGNWWVEWENGCGLDVPDEKLTPLIEVGDRFAVARGITQECTVIEVVKGKKPYYIKWELKGEEQQVDLEFFRKLKRLDIEELNSWNPAEFGSVDYKADGDQLTIFHDDTNEPPDPDDYPTVADYEKAWSEWKKNLTTEEPKIMTDTAFQFSATSAIASQIAQIQEQLNQLTASLKASQQYEQKAEELRQEVAQHSREMVNKGIPQEDILRWGKAIYSAATGVELVESDNGVVAAQNEIITDLRVDRAELQRLRSEAMELLKSTTQERDELKLRLEKIEQTNTSAIELLHKENEELRLANSGLQSRLDFEKKPADQVMMDRLKPNDDNSTISERIINILKGQNELSGNQIIELLGMDTKTGRGAYMELTRLSDKGVILCSPDPLDRRRKLYSLPLANNTQQFTQHDTLTSSVPEQNTQQNTQHAINNTQQNTQHGTLTSYIGDESELVTMPAAGGAIANIDPDVEVRELIDV